MSPEKQFTLERDMLEYFARKGCEDDAGTPTTNRNGLKVRRILQMIRDLAGQPFEKLSVLDLACGEGVYAIECALRRAKVLAVDARTERMDIGRQFAQRLSLENLRFEQADVRQVTLESHGVFDVILFMGILYHLDAPDVFNVMRNLLPMCGKMLVIDTHIATQPSDVVVYEGRTYQGCRVREHGDSDPLAIRQKRVLMSADNTFSFHFSRASLVNFLADIGYTSVFECLAPLDPSKPEHRVTLIATRSEPVRLSSYPWVNEMPREKLAALFPIEQHPVGGRLHWLRRILRLAGIDIRRIPRSAEIQ